MKSNHLNTEGRVYAVGFRAGSQYVRIGPLTTDREEAEEWLRETLAAKLIECEVDETTFADISVREMDEKASHYLPAPPDSITIPLSSSNKRPWGDEGWKEAER